MTPGARLEAAIALLTDILEHPARPADAVATAYFRARRFIGGGDRRAIGERVYGVLRHLAQLRWWIERARYTAPVSARTLILADLVLRDGWDQAEIARAFDGGRHRPAPIEAAEAGLLHRLAGHTMDHPAQPDAVRFNIPDWIEPRLRAAYGEALARELAALAEPASLDLRANPLKTTREEAAEALAAEGIEARPTALSPLGLRVKGRPPVVTGASFRGGLVEVQDEGSQLVALLADARPGMRVADYCAGAGGKTLVMAAAMENRGAVVACDVSAPRLEHAVKRLRRAGISNVTRRILDAEARKWLKRAAGTFDRVLVDAPCTGTGTWRRNPDARWTLTPDDLAELTAKQAGIMDAAARLVKPGGRLVYATCSLLPEENEAQMEAFLARQPDFAPLAMDEVWQAALGGRPPAEARVGPWLRLTPARAGTDGFFVGIVVRAAPVEAQEPAA